MLIVMEVLLLIFWKFFKIELNDTIYGGDNNDCIDSGGDYCEGGQ